MKVREAKGSVTMMKEHGGRPARAGGLLVGPLSLSLSSVG